MNPTIVRFFFTVTVFLVSSVGWCASSIKAKTTPTKHHFSMDVTLGSWMTDRAYQTSTDAFDATFDGLARLRLYGRSWGVFYKGGWSAYFNDTTLTQHSHQLTGEKRFDLPFLNGSLALGGAFSWEDYADFFTTYDRIRPEVYAGIKLYTTRNSTVRLLSTVGYAAYFNSNQYSHLYTTLTLQGTTWFPSKTSIRVQADWTHKAYLESVSSSTDTLIDPNVTNSHRLRLYARVAQSLWREAALRLWGAWLPKLNQEYRFNDTKATTINQNLSDDLNVLDGGSAGLEFEYRPRWMKGLRVTLLGYWLYNHFGGHAARDANGNVLSGNAEREDVSWNMGATLAWKLPFDASGFWGNGLFLKASYLYRINTSNDTSFTYNQHLAYLGLGTSW